MSSWEFVPINCGIPPHPSGCRNSKRSEKSVAQIEAESDQVHRKEETNSAKHGNHAKCIDVWPRCCHAGKNSRHRCPADALRKLRSGSHCHLRVSTRASAVAGPPVVTALRYGSISGKGNRVTLVTCRSIASSAPVLWQVRYFPTASATLRKLRLLPLH